MNMRQKYLCSVEPTDVECSKNNLPHSVCVCVSVRRYIFVCRHLKPQYSKEEYPHHLLLAAKR